MGNRILRISLFIQIAITSCTPFFKTEVAGLPSGATSTPESFVPMSLPTTTETMIPSLAPSATSTMTSFPTVTSTATKITIPGIQDQSACAIYNIGFDLQVISLINARRSDQGLAVLSASYALNLAARNHSSDMACNDFFSHAGSNGSSMESRIASSGSSFSWMGENIAAGQASPEEVVASWMGSPGHRENILNPNFTQIGTCYAYSADSTYGHYWTVTFGSP